MPEKKSQMDLEVDRQLALIGGIGPWLVLCLFLLVAGISITYIAVNAKDALIPVIGFFTTVGAGIGGWKAGVKHGQAKGAPNASG